MKRRLKLFNKLISFILATAFAICSVNVNTLSAEAGVNEERKDIEESKGESESDIGHIRGNLPQGKVVSQVRHKHIPVTQAGSGDGLYKGTITFSVPRRSRGSYSDSVSWSLRKLHSTGGGRGRDGQKSTDLDSNGNTLKVHLDHLLDYEKYDVTVSYVQTYYWDEWHTGSYTDAEGVVHTYSYTTMESDTVSGTLSDSYTTPQDHYIRDAYDLKEKVHKYSQVSLADDIDCGGLQSVVDGETRGSWLSAGGISSVTIDGNGRYVKRGGEGAVILVHNGAALSLKDIYIRAYSGDIISTPTDGGEYITENASGGAGGVGVLVGCDVTLDDKPQSAGTLHMTNSEVCAGRSAVVFRYGAMNITSSMMYGMGAKDNYKVTGSDGYYGTGLGLINSYSGPSATANVSDDCSIYGRFNGVYIQGNASLKIRDSLIRGDCEDAFDFRGSNDLDISGCTINGVKGIDNFHDATYQGIIDALDISSGRFDEGSFSKRVLPDKKSYDSNKDGLFKGKVTVSNTIMDLITGPFSGNADAVGIGIQNHGHIDIGSGVVIYVRHSGAWTGIPSGSRAKAEGIWNSKKMILPDDIVIDTDGIGIESTRDMDSVRSALRMYHQMNDEQTAEIEKKAVSDDRIFTHIDDGMKSSLSVRGGTISGDSGGIICYYGGLMIEPESQVYISGRDTGISVGRNGIDNIYGDEAMNVNFLIDGNGRTDVTASLAGNGIVVKKTAHAEMYSGLHISGTETRCGSGIVNHGLTQMKNAVINAEQYGIKNSMGGKLIMGDDLEEENNAIDIAGSITGIHNSGELIYYRHVNITGSDKAAVLQNGILYMLAGSEVEPDKEGHNVIYLNPGHTVRLFYDESEEDLIESTKGTFMTGKNDREPGRVMVELHSPWGAGGGIDYSDENYTDLSNEEKIGLTEQMTGFDLAFDEVHGHQSALKSGLGKYKDEDTNGRTGTLVLSCLLAASYDADFPVKNDHISSKNPEKTPYYWREPTEFTVASDLYETDRSRIFYDGWDVTAGLRQVGWRDKETDGKYGEKIYAAERITRIFGDDHVFSGIWDTAFTFVFDGNGQTNGAENYKESGIGTGYTFPGNTGPERKQLEYFRKSVKKNDRLHPVAYDGWSLDDKAIYKDDGIFREGDTLDDATGFYIDAVSHENVTISDDTAEVRIYAVWDEYPVITAFDSYFYEDELDDASEIKKSLLSEKVVSATDLCDGDLPQDQIEVYTDPGNESFDISVMKELGDLGSVNVYYKASDYNGHTSVAVAKAHIMTEDSEDSSDDISHDTQTGKSGTSKDTMDSAPVYVRNIDSGNRDSLIKNSVWREEEYDSALSAALDKKYSEKWKFDDSDIAESKKMLYNDRSGIREWRQRFLRNRTENNIEAKEDRNKPMIVEEGLSSLRIVWDLKSETDRIDITLTASDGSSVKVPPVRRAEGRKMQSGVVVNSLKPGMVYDIAADLYYRDSYINTLSQTVRTASLEKPDIEFSSEDTGKLLRTKIVIRADSNADRYIIERRKVSEEQTEWEEAGVVKRTGDASLTYKEEIKAEGIYRYRVMSKGSQIGRDDLTESSDYTDEIETAFLKQPIIRETESGCRSIGVHFEGDTDADYVRLFYRTADGSTMHSDYKDIDGGIVISDGRLLDGTEYEISAMAYISSPEGGRTYCSLLSETVNESTFVLKNPDITNPSQKQIYSADGNLIKYETDEHADGYRISIRRLHPIMEEPLTENIEADGEYLHTPDRTGMYSYIVMADFKTLDGKEFHLDSDTVEAAYIIPQTAEPVSVEDGSKKTINYYDDPDADAFMIKVEKKDGTSDKIYVPKSNGGRAIVSATGEDLKVTEIRSVLFYNGKEYRGEFAS